ncbi:MAG: hypothetical protein JJU06_03020 [Ectothiorhodospiraceae bacterium]|nr:hypothetical protein [Ectothiorhodospiraceae bacterium]MCH8504675.1 hypothetical protein [Ectothiorhodospiraceae bacterium]
MKGLPALVAAGYLLLLPGCQAQERWAGEAAQHPEGSVTLLEGGTASPGLSDYHRRRLQRLGLEDPEHDLVADLVRRRELITEQGVLGGTMYFVAAETHVLTGRWVLATFEDGHVRGHLLLEYNVEEGGDINWRPMESYVD